MGIIINLTGAVLLVLFAVYIFRKKSHEKRLNAYFCNAVRLYALTNEEDARIAIITAAKVASKSQRGSMVKYLQSMASGIKKMIEKDSKIKHHTAKFVELVFELVEEISSREWTVSDIIKQKEELGNINSEYLVALDEKTDPTIFEKKHPQLFK
ncbi:hypothetical protein ACFLZ5_05925 [Thermodesulfobacteriota bacterium]